MKNIFNSILKIALICFLFAMSSCEKDLYEAPIYKTGVSKITLQQLQQETGLKEFSSYRLRGSVSDIAKLNSADYFINTDEILKYMSEKNKITYSLKIFPIGEEIKQSEYYNLVYEKYNGELNEIIFKNTDKANPQPEEPKLESSEMIYNKNFTLSDFCTNVSYSFHCVGCVAACDLCPLCMTTTVSYELCGSSEGDSFNNGLGNSDGSGGGGGGGSAGAVNSGGVFIPLPYNGDIDLNNQSFILAGNTCAFLNALPAPLKAIGKNQKFYPFIIDFFRQNGGLTQENKDKIIFTLTNLQPILNLNLPDWTFTDIDLLNYNAFNFLLQNPNNSGSYFTQTIVNSQNDLIDVDFSKRIIYGINKPCQKQFIKDIVDTCSPFTELIQQTFDSNDIANIKFSNGNVTAANAYTNPNWSGTPQNFTISIRFDDNFLNTGTNLAMVAVTLHELVHAYLMNLYIKGTLVATNSNYNTLLNAFMAFYNNQVQDTFDPLDNEIHNAMKDFIGKMANSIYNYAISKNISITADYCEKLAWGTMTGTDLFNETLNSDEQIESNNTFAYEQDNIQPQAKGSDCN